MTRRATIDRPFTAGMVTDLPSTRIPAQASVYAQDLIAPEGIARQRKGWAYDGTTADVADNLVAVHRNKFLINENTRTVTCDDDGDMFLHNAAGAGTALFTGSVQYLPRCVYRDEVIWCAQDGTTGIQRHSGAIAAVTTSGGGTAEWADGKATITGRTWASAPASGSFVPIYVGDNTAQATTYGRVLEGTTSSITVEGMRAGGVATASGTNGNTQQTGGAYPGVAIYDAGTMSISATVATGYGTDFSGAGVVAGDHVLMIPSDTTIQPSHGYVGGSITATGIGFVSLDDTADPYNYQITRALPFKDAAVHKESLWGTGVAQYPNRVYYGRPGWNLSLPPGSTPPLDPTLTNQSVDANDFLMGYRDVPSPYDGDVNVALLSSPSPLLVLKRRAVYGVYGVYTPNTSNDGFSTDKIADGVGCIDRRSAISGPNGQFWAGEDGIFGYIGGQVIDLTRGKINREWRGLIRDYDFGTLDYCAIGETYDHLIVSLVTGGGTTARTYVFDMVNQAWTSRFTNHKARYFFSSRVDGERSELYWVGDNDQGRVMKSARCFDGTGIAKDGDGDSPRMQAWTGWGLDGTQTVEEDERLLDLSVVSYVNDSGVAGSTSMNVTVNASMSLEDDTPVAKDVGDIGSDPVPFQRTRFRAINTKGRLHRVLFDVDTLGTNDASTKVEIHELSATFRTRRSRT